MTRPTVLIIATNKLKVVLGQTKDKKWGYTIYQLKNRKIHQLLCVSKAAYGNRLEAKKAAGQTVKKCRELLKSGDLFDLEKGE